MGGATAAASVWPGPRLGGDWTGQAGAAAWQSAAPRPHTPNQSAQGDGSVQGAAHLPGLCRLGQDHKRILLAELVGKTVSGSLEVRVLLKGGLDVLVCTMWQRPGELEY